MVLITRIVSIFLVIVIRIHKVIVYHSDVLNLFGLEINKSRDESLLTRALELAHAVE